MVELVVLFILFFGLVFCGVMVKAVWEVSTADRRGYVTLRCRNGQHATAGFLRACDGRATLTQRCRCGCHQPMRVTHG